MTTTNTTKMNANPMTNSQIQAAKTDEQKKADRGTKEQVSLAKNLHRSHQLIRGTGSECDLAEIRDNARNGLVVYSGTYDACVSEAKRLGLWC